MFFLGWDINYNFIALLKNILNSTLVAIGYLLDGFLVLYTNYYDLNNSFFSINAPSNVDVNTWHTILGHIRQEKWID